MRPTDQVLKDLSLAAFKPDLWLRSGFLQTVAGAYWPQPRENPDSEIHKIALDKQDHTTIAVDRPLSWKAGDRIVLLVHGLAGSIHSNYMTRLANRLPRENIMTIRMNLRNCGSAFGMSRRTYHAGITEDPRAMLKWINEKYPGSPVTAVGFSLGGNLLLKMVTEDGAQPTSPLDSVAAISPATDLARSSAKLNKIPGRWLGQLFMRELISDVEKLAKIYPGIPPVSHLRGKRIRDFDEQHVAKMNGFAGADDYYARASSLAHLDRISIPTFILGAKDDPVVEFVGLTDAKLPDNIDVILTDVGGHVGFVGDRRAKGGARWADTALSAWVKARL